MPSPDSSFPYFGFCAGATGGSTDSSFPYFGFCADWLVSSTTSSSKGNKVFCGIDLNYRSKKALDGGILCQF